MLNLNFNPFPEIKTERLILRKITHNDVADFFEIRSNTSLMQYIGRPVAKTIDDVKFIIDKMISFLDSNEGINWGITQKDNPKLIGVIGFWKIDKENYRAEIGYILNEKFHKKGITHEALETLLKYGFTTLQFNSVEAVVNPENEGSIKLLEKNNFVREAYFKQKHFFEGKFYDSATYSLLHSIK